MLEQRLRNVGRQRDVETRALRQAEQGMEPRRENVQIRMQQTIISAFLPEKRVLEGDRSSCLLFA